MTKVICASYMYTDIVHGVRESSIFFKVEHMNEKLRVDAPKEWSRLLYKSPETQWKIISSSYPYIDIFHKQIHLRGWDKGKDHLETETERHVTSYIKTAFSNVKKTVNEFNSVGVKYPRYFRNRFEMLEV